MILNMPNNKKSINLIGNKSYIKENDYINKIYNEINKVPITLKKL